MDACDAPDAILDVAIALIVLIAIRATQYAQRLKTQINT